MTRKQIDQALEEGERSRKEQEVDKFTQYCIARGKIESRMEVSATVRRWFEMYKEEVL